MEGDSISQVRQFHRQLTVDVVTRWVKCMLEDHVEPQRAGLRKGAKVGDSKKRKSAALFSVVHSLRNKNLREVAQLAGTTESTMKSWRTQQAFLEACNNAIDKFAKTLKNTLEMAVALSNGAEGPEESFYFSVLGDYKMADSPSEMAELIIYMLPFFHPKVESIVSDYVDKESRGPSLDISKNIHIRESIIGGSGGDVTNIIDTVLSSYGLSKLDMMKMASYRVLRDHLNQSATVFDKSDARKYTMDKVPESMRRITSMFDLLSDPNQWTPDNCERSKKLLDSLREMIFREYSLLSERDCVWP